MWKLARHVSSLDFQLLFFSSFDRIQVKYGDTWAPHRGCHNWHNRTIIDLERDDVITEVYIDTERQNL